MGKRIVIALGGNALGKNLPEQMLAVKETSKAIADLVEAGHTVVVAHGNGPQVGMIQNAFAAYCRQEPSADVMPLSMCVAMSQGYIGYDLQNALKEELLNRGLQQGVATVLTQVVVEGDDPAFQHPTKPIGAFMSKEEAEKMAYVDYLEKKYGKKIGIHAHNNQQLAFANTTECAMMGVSYLDATMAAMGRGAGNCAMELLMGFLKNPKYDIKPVLRFLQDEMQKLKNDGVVWGYDIQYLLTGYLNQHPRTAIAFTNEKRQDYFTFFQELQENEV